MQSSINSSSKLDDDLEGNEMKQIYHIGIIDYL